MANKQNWVDTPDYDPNLEHLPFPPSEQDYKEAETNYNRPKNAKPVHATSPYTETYISDAPAPDPSQTIPGAPDIRDIDASIPEACTTGDLSPNVELKEEADTGKINQV